MKSPHTQEDEANIGTRTLACERQVAAAAFCFRLSARKRLERERGGRSREIKRGGLLREVRKEKEERRNE